ncbi:ubiquinone anaerobic biosynthesis accessory factor UbiT [Duffyella gerundensis]|uniref:ubiquinone anaerobic biosynthesis accessory factor UbiT n=1 Tax=Duffyella gerundensis TaxID=1619313 RepID=UPI0021F6D32C
MLKRLQNLCVQNGPALVGLPVALTPFPLRKRMLEQLLNAQFRQALAEGDLDFLQDHFLGIDILDMGLRWVTTLQQGQLSVMARDDADVWFRGNANDLLLVAARKADPDMLFFQRRLAIEGDTELGLEVKNLMDAMEFDAMPRTLLNAMQQLATWIEAARTMPSTDGSSGRKSTPLI